MQLTKRQFVTMATAILLGGCVDYNPAFESALLNSSAADSSATEEDFIACDNPDEVLIFVEDRDYKPQCGCIESEEKACTTSVGKTVIWLFRDSTAHNVTSVPETFGGSGDNSSGGRFEATFTEPGEYAYGCTIHADMRGYKIIVE